MARLAVVPDLDQELDELFAAPLDRFTAARNELAKRLKSAGQDEAAEQIRGLKKPSVPVWTVNQLARRQPDAVARAVEVGEQLRRAQEEAFGGGGADAVRRATAAERETVRELTRLAEQILRDEGRPATRAVLDRIATTLRAAAVDPDVARLLSHGRLTEEVDSPGFAAVAALAPSPSRRRRSSRPSAADRAARRAREQRIRRLEQRLESLERRAADADERAEHAAAAAAAAHDAVAAAADELERERAHSSE